MLAQVLEVADRARQLAAADLHVLGPHADRHRLAGLVCRAQVDAQGLPAGEAVTIGVRPEHVQVGAGELSGTVTHLEHLGEHSYAYLKLDADAAPLVVKTQRGDLRVGERLPFALPAEQVHVFRADGSALPRRRA